MEDLFQSQKPNLEEEIKPSRAVHFWQLGAGLFVLLSLFLGLFVWQERYTNDSLLQYAPVDTAIYISARDSFWPWEKVKITDLPLAHVFSHPELLNFSSHSALLKIPGENQELTTAEIFFLRHLEEAVPVIAELEFTATLDKHILVVADSQETLEKIKEVQRGTIFSLAQQLEGRQLGRGLMNLYVSAGNLQSHFKALPGLPSQLLSHLAVTDLYLTLYQERNIWVFGPADEINLSSADLKTTLRFLPKNFDLFISQVNLVDVFRSFVAVDENFNQAGNQLTVNLEAIYDFNFNNAIIPLLDQPAELLIINSGRSNALGFDYILVLPEVTDQQIQAFEELVRIILSQKLPKEISRQLPDGSSVIELTADTNAWLWQPVSENQRILSEPQLGFEVTHLKNGGSLFIASSAALLEDIMKTQDISLESLAYQCPPAVGAGNFLAIRSDLQATFGDILPQGITIFSTTPKNGLTGCIFNY